MVHINLKTINRLLLCIIGILFILNTLVGCTKIDNDGYYNNIKWGITCYDLKEKLNDDNLLVGDNSEYISQDVDNFYGINNTKAHILYVFHNNELISISITIFINDNSDLSYDKLYNIIYKKITKKYGDYSTIDSNKYIWNKNYSNIILDHNDKLVSLIYRNSQFHFK